MATYKLNVARIRGLPQPEAIGEALAEFGLPDTEEFGVLNHSVTPQAVAGQIVRKTTQAVQKLDAEHRDVTAEAVEKVTVFPFSVWPAQERMEIYAGSASTIEHVGAFFSVHLAFATVTEPIEVDIVSAIESLMANTNKFQFRSARVSDYSANSFMSGPYTPKFMDTQHGLDFLEKYAAGVTTAAVKFAAKAGRATATLTPQAAFSYSCKEEDQVEVQTVLRGLL